MYVRGGATEKQALHDINRILKQDGMLFIWNLPYKYGSVEMLNHLLGRWHHDRRYTKKGIVTLLEDSGFEIICFDHHELLNMTARNIMGKIIGHDNAFIFDYYISKLPIVNLMLSILRLLQGRKKYIDIIRRHTINSSFFPGRNRSHLEIIVER